MTQYFIHDGQNEKGPLGIEQLKFESLKQDTPIWYEGLESWTTARQVEELKFLFSVKPTPPPLIKSIPPVVTPPRIEQTSYSTPIHKELEPTTKKNLKVTLIIAASILVIAIIGWLIYQNKNQAATLNQVQEKVTQQDQQLTLQQQEQQAKEQQRLLEEQQVQAEKDRINAALTEKYMGYRNNWKNFITAGHQPFSVGLLGGISDLSITVYNQTDKAIDEVQVQVNYSRSSGASTGTQIVSVTNIGPNSSKTVSAPNGSGSNVSEEIISVTAKSFHFCYPYGMDGNKDLDPYFCK